MVTIKIPPEEAIALLSERIDDIAAMGRKQCDLGYYDMVGWCSRTWAVVDEIFGSDNYHSEEIRLIGVPACSCNSPGATQMQLEIYHSHLLKYIDQIRADMTTQEKK
jgi:hypothetical protein